MNGSRTSFAHCPFVGEAAAENGAPSPGTARQAAAAARLAVDRVLERAAGALSLALVLALPLEVPSREVLVVSTYAVVLFTLLIQGLSIRWVLRSVLLSPARQAPSEGDHSTDEQVIVNSSPEEAREPPQ